MGQSQSRAQSPARRHGEIASYQAPMPQMTPRHAREGSREPTDFVQWSPRIRSAICVFSVALGDALSLLPGIEHNANWAIAHGSSFTLFRRQMSKPGLWRNWDKVLAAQRMLQRDECAWAMFIDADAVVMNVDQGPAPLLARMQREAAPARPLMFAACNSPLGRGLECDTFCCGRAQKKRAKCTVGLRDQGPAAPYPCLINSGVFLIQNSPEAHSLVRDWYKHHTDKETQDGDPFYEQVARRSRSILPAGRDLHGRCTLLLSAGRRASTC